MANFYVIRASHGPLYRDTWSLTAGVYDGSASAWNKYCDAQGVPPEEPDPGKRSLRRTFQRLAEEAGNKCECFTIPDELVMLMADRLEQQRKHDLQEKRRLAKENRERRNATKDSK